MIEIAEPAAVAIGTDEAERARFRDLHERLLAGLADPGPAGPSPVGAPVPRHHGRFGRRGRPRHDPGSGVRQPRRRPDRRPGQLAPGHRDAGPARHRLRRAVRDRGLGRPSGTAALGGRICGVERRTRACQGRDRDRLVAGRALLGGRDGQAGQPRGSGATGGTARRGAPRRHRPTGHRQPERGARPVRACTRHTASGPVERLRRPRHGASASGTHLATVLIPARHGATIVGPRPTGRRSDRGPECSR